MREKSLRKKGIKQIWIILFICSFLPASLVSCRKQDTAKQNEVVLYCSVDQEFAEPIVKQFEEQTGVKVLARFDTEASKTVGLVQRLRSEAAKPVADVFWSGEVFYTIRLTREGLLAPYESEQTKNWPEIFKDPSDRWYGFGLRDRKSVV